MAMAIIDGYKVGGVDEPTVADEYNEEREWEAGEFCIYNSTLYKCNTATTGEFDSDSWDVTSCGLEMKEINSNLIANEINVPTSSWVSDSTNPNYGYKATISSALYSNNFIPQYVDLIPYGGSAFFSEGENEAKGILNPNIVINASGVTFYASEIPSVALKFRIGGQA